VPESELKLKQLALVQLAPQVLQQLVAPLVVQVHLLVQMEPLVVMPLVVMQLVQLVVMQRVQNCEPVQILELAEFHPLVRQLQVLQVLMLKSVVLVSMF
jgi:hypothetical protein